MPMTIGMSVTRLRVPVRAAFPRPRLVRAPDLLLAEISSLVAERQSLRTAGDDAPALERNRQRIARAQWELSYALIDRHCPHVAAA